MPRSRRRRPSILPACVRLRCAASTSSRIVAAEEVLGVEASGDQVGVGERGLLAPAAVARRARFGARAPGPDVEAACLVELAIELAARADLDDLDDGDLDRVAGRRGVRSTWCNVSIGTRPPRTADVFAVVPPISSVSTSLDTETPAELGRRRHAGDGAGLQERDRRLERARRTTRRRRSTASRTEVTLTPTSRSPERRSSRYAATVGFTYADRTVVLVRSYSRHCVLTSCEATISTSGRVFDRGAGRPVARAPGSSTRAGSRSRPRSRRVPAGVGRPTPKRPSSRGTEDLTGVCEIRSGTSNRRRRGTNGRGLRYDIGCTGPAGSPGPISSTSRNPSVVTSAVRAPRQLGDGVDHDGAAVHERADVAGPEIGRSSADSTPCWRRVGVVPTFARIREPSRRSTAARSVNVPPMSIASAIGPGSLPIRALYPAVASAAVEASGTRRSSMGSHPRRRRAGIRRWPARCVKSARS